MFKPMLAVNAIMSKFNKPMLGSKKMEGVRAEFTPEGLKTRPMKNFNNKWLAVKFNRVLNFCKENNVVIEGEFYIHGVEFNIISSICRRAEHEDTDSIELHLFDAYNPLHPSANFQSRVNFLIDNIKELGQSVYVVQQVYIATAEQAKEQYMIALEEGYEGYVLKDPNLGYKTGRSTVLEGYFLRMKEEDTYDGKVVRIEERMENLVESERNELGMMAKTQDKDMKAPTGLAAVAVTLCDQFPGQEIRVTLSRKIKDYEDKPDIPSRESLWRNREDYPGRNIRFVGIPVKGMLPRAPRFDAWRTDLD
jgi:hypothetical protein